MIFFKWNSAELTTRDKETIAQAAMHAKRLIDRQGTVRVQGYVDTSLSQQRSSTLSERMAKVVRDELVRDGIAPAVITYVGVGKAQLLKCASRSTAGWKSEFSSRLPLPGPAPSDGRAGGSI